MKSKIFFYLTFKRWWRGASKLGHVKSQEEMELANNELKRAFDYDFPLNTRKFLHEGRWGFFNLMWKWFYGKGL